MERTVSSNSMTELTTQSETRTPPPKARPSWHGNGEPGGRTVGPLALESPAPRYAQVSAGSPTANRLHGRERKRIALVFEGLGADPVKCRAQVLAVASPLATKLRGAYEGDLEHDDAVMPSTQLPVCVMLALLRLEAALLSPDVPLGFGDLPLVCAGHSAGFLAAACVSLNEEDPFAHAQETIKCAQRIGRELASMASPESCALLLPKTPATVAAMKVRGQTSVVLGLVNSPVSCVLTGASMAAWKGVVAKTVPLPIRWPVHSPLLEAARAALKDCPELDFLKGEAACTVLSPENGEDVSSLLRESVLGTLTSAPVLWPLVLEQLEQRSPDEVVFLGDAYGLCAWHPSLGTKRTYQMKSSDGGFQVKIRAQRDENVEEEEAAEDDSMALFAKKGLQKRKAGDAADAMQGHAYFAPMLGILLTHGNVHTLPGKGDPSNAEPWTGLQQLHANLGAGFGLPLFFAVAGVGDERSFWKRGGVEKQTTWEMLKPLLTVYGTMVVLSALTHVTYEGLYRNCGLRWAPKQKKPWPLRPNLTRTKWFVFILALARLVGRVHRRACKKHPKLYPINVLVALLLMFVVQVEVDQVLELKGSGLGSMPYGWVCGVFAYIAAPSLLPIGLLTPKSYAFAADDVNASLEYAVPSNVLRRWRRFAAWFKSGVSRVAPWPFPHEAQKDGVVRIPSHWARPLCFLVIYLRLLASASSTGYRAAIYDSSNDDAWAGSSVSKSERWTYAWVCILRSDCKAGGPSTHFSSKSATYLITVLDYAFSILYSTAACYCAPARRSVFSDAGSLCLFAYMWHRCLLPVLDALVLRVHKKTKADALLVLPLYVLFQILISAPFPQLGEVFERLKRGRVRFRDVANPFQLFAGLFLLGVLSYAWG